MDAITLFHTGLAFFLVAFLAFKPPTKGKPAVGHFGGAKLCFAGVCQQRSQHPPELLGGLGWHDWATHSMVGKDRARAAPVAKPVPIPKPRPVHQDLSQSGSRELPRSLW